MEAREVRNGMRIYVKGEGTEVFTISQWDGERGWAGDERGRGWYVRANQIEPVDDAESEDD